ncbi:branched-chain amino acid ABC transporter permease [Streptosporangiaceae bacterium NEAU-GS5]|nr:branched-chain amino acid ABC transporter permease [Streptosporangiaceae bacterium NEAU-GS5]
MKFLALITVVLAGVPFYAGPAWERPLIDLLTLAAMASLWNLLAGFAGLASFGQQAYLGIGAYALFATGLDPLVGVPVAAVAAGLAAVPASVPLLRLSGGHFAVATWVLAEIARLTVSMATGNTGVALPAAHEPLLRQAITYWWALAVAAGAVGGILLLSRGRYGLAARAVAGDAVAAAASGVKVTWTRRVAYCLAATGTGAVGAVLFADALYVQPSSIFNVQYSVSMMFMVLIGGIRTVEGPLLGALIFFGLQRALAGYGPWYLILLGVIAILMTLFLPRGIIGKVGRPWKSRAGRSYSVRWPLWPAARRRSKDRGPRAREPS